MTNAAHQPADLDTLRNRCATLFDEVWEIRLKIEHLKDMFRNCPWKLEEQGVPAMEAKLAQLIEDRNDARLAFKAARRNA